MQKVNTTPQVLCNKLTEVVNDIWKNGLTEEHFIKLTDIFVQNNNLDLSQRKLILECMVPQFVVDDVNVRKLLFWIFSSYISDPEATVLALNWLTSLLRYKLIQPTCLQQFYGQLATCFQSDCLIKPLCSLLKLLTNEKTVNKRTAFLIQEFYNDFNRAEIKNLLWEIKKYRPHLIDVEFKTQPPGDNTVTDFDKVLMKACRKQGLILYNGTIDNTKVASLIPGTLPQPEYFDEDNICTNKKLTNISSANELGRSVSDINLTLPENPVSLISSKIGLVYLQLFGPGEEFLCGLQAILESQPTHILLLKLCELQNRLRHGLPFLTKYLARFLLTWDGLESQRLVYDLIKWIHFDTYSDFSSLIIVPLTRLYICSNVDVKITILQAISGLLINMVSVHMERLHQDQEKLDNITEKPHWLDNPMDTFTKMCSDCQSLIMTGLMLEGLNSASLILQAITFYNTIITLQLEFSLICFIPPLPLVVHAALTSMNHIVLSEAGSLIIRYEKNLIPFLDNLGITDQFAEEIEGLKEISENMFNYLWLNKDPSEGSLIHQRNERSGSISAERLRKHPGVFPLIEFLAMKLKINPNTIRKKDLLPMLVNYSEGLGEFIQHHLKEIEMDH